MKAILLFSTLLGVEVIAAPCSLKIKVNGTISTGIEKNVEMQICSPDQTKRKVDLQWNGERVLGKAVPREKVERFLTAVQLADRDLASLKLEKAAACNHFLEVDLERNGKPQHFRACERTPRHTILRRFYEMVRDAYFYK